MIPKGKGIYGRSRFLDDKYARFLSGHGIEWYVPISTSRLKRQVEIGAKHNIIVHGGDIPHPNKTRTGALAALGTLAAACTKASGDDVAWHPDIGSMHLDMEEGVFWKEDFCRLFLRRARELFRGTIGVTCYGSHKGLLKGMQGADYYVDQVYDRNQKETANQLAMFLASLQKFLDQNLRPVALALGAFLNYKTGGKRVTTIKPYDRFERHVRGCPPVFAAGFWTLPSFQVEPLKFKKHWDLIGRWDPATGKVS